MKHCPTCEKKIGWRRIMRITRHENQCRCKNCGSLLQFTASRRAYFLKETYKLLAIVIILFSIAFVLTSLQTLEKKAFFFTMFGVFACAHGILLFSYSYTYFTRKTHITVVIKGTDPINLHKNTRPTILRK